MKANLRSLINGAHKNAVSVQRHRIAREDAARIRQADKVGGQEAGLRAALEILFNKPRQTPD
jgi:hypothetical protein